MTTDASLQSLLRALQPGYERPAPAAAWEGVARRFLRPGETVLLALEGEGLTWVDPLMLVTDGRVLHLRRGLRWRLLREAPTAEARGAEYSPGLLGGRVRIRLDDGSALRMRRSVSRGESLAQDFVAGVNALVAGGRGTVHR